VKFPENETDKFFVGSEDFNLYQCNLHSESKFHIEQAMFGHFAPITAIDVHPGLSLRVFEALGAGKKLITTNPQVLRCDFYHPDNIHLLTDDDAALAKFLSVPAVPVAPELRLRHGFSAWLRRVLEMEAG
jgi:hypothetical protein